MGTRRQARGQRSSDRSPQARRSGYTWHRETLDYHRSSQARTSLSQQSGRTPQSDQRPYSPGLSCQQLALSASNASQTASALLTLDATWQSVLAASPADQTCPPRPPLAASPADSPDGDSPPSAVPVLAAARRQGRSTGTTPGGLSSRAPGQRKGQM